MGKEKSLREKNKPIGKIKPNRKKPLKKKRKTNYQKKKTFG